MRVIDGKHGFGTALQLRRVYPGYKVIILLIRCTPRRSHENPEREGNLVKEKKKETGREIARACVAVTW